jgi:hypothetical protein
MPRARRQVRGHGTHAQRVTANGEQEQNAEEDGNVFEASRA